MRYLISIFILFFCLSAFSQDRIELGYQTSKRGIVWVRPGLPTHEPVWRVTRDTNAILWHDKTTGIRYDWSYESSTWNRKDVISQTLPPLESLTSGLATINNTTADWINDDGILHFYDNSQNAWVPHSMSFQSLAPADIPSDIGNAAAIYTTTLWQDSDDFLVYYWDGDSWELLSGSGTDLSYTGTSSPITLNSSTGADVTITAGTGISLAGTSSDLTISGTAAGLSKWTDAGAYTYLTATTDKAVVGSSTQIGSNYEFQSNGGVYSRGPIRADMNADSAGLVIRQNATQTNPLFRMEYSNGTFAGGANIYNSTNRSTVFGAVGSVHSSSPNNLVFGYSPNLVFAAGNGSNAYFNNGGSASHTGYENAYFGIACGVSTTDGFQNFGGGYQALNKITTGYQNMALGRQSMLNATTARNNVAAGANTLRSATAATNMVVLGDNSAISATTAGESIVIGNYAAGNKTTITGSVLIGQEVASGTGSSVSNQLWIDNSNTSTPLISGDFSTDRVGVNTAHASLAQTFNVTGTARITGSTGTATTVMGRDGNGDISALSLSGMSISSGTLTATDGSTTNELQTLANTSDATSHTVTLSNSGGSFQLVEGSGVTLTTTGTSGDGVVTIAATGAATDLTFSGTSSPVTLNSSTGADVTITAGTGISLAGTSSDLTITNTGAAALSGVVNQIPYFNTSTTITTEAGSGTNSLTWDDTNNRLGVGTASPGSIIEAVVPASTNGITSNYTYFTGASQRPFKAVNQDGLETFAIGASRAANEGNLFLRAPSVQGSGAGVNFSSNNGGTAVSGIFQLDNSGNMVFRQESGSGSMYYDFRSGVYFRNSSFTSVNHINSSGWLSIAAGNSHPRALYVNGEARITDLTTDTPTGVVGADADGDLGLLAFSGMSIISGTLTATDGSTTNELQTLANTSDATSHTVTLSNSGGSFQLVEGSGVTLTTTGTSGAGVVTIAATGAGTDLTFSGASSPVTLNSSTGTDVTYTAGTGISLSASSSNLTVTNSAPDQTVSITNGGGVSVSGTYPSFTLTATDASATNEAQTLSVSGTTSGIISLNAIGGVGGGTATIAAGTNIGVSQSGGTITINNTGAAALSGVVGQIPYFNTTSTITTESGSGTSALTWDDTNKRLGVSTTSPGAKIEAVVPASTHGIVSNYTYAVGMGQRPFRAINQDGLETFAIGANRTTNEGNIFLNAPSVQGSGAGINFTSNNGASTVTGLFQLDNSGNMVFRQGSAGASLFYDFGSGVFFRNSSFTNVNHINGSGWLSIAAGNTHPRTLYVNGEARVADLVTDPPTVVLGADADGDLGTLSLSGLSISSGTLTATDASATNEAQTLSVSGTTSGILSLNAISGVGGGTATIAAGTGITVGQSGGTITITNSSPATAGWLLDGNTITTAKRIGSNDNFDVVVETNNTDRMWFDNAGTVSIGATQLTTAALNINGLQTGTGMLISGGASLVGPNFYTATGSGSGSTATVLSGVLSMLSGNVEGIMKNTVTSGTGGGALFTVNVSPTATSNDAFFKWQTDGVTDWSMGIDNSDVDNLKLHRFSRPSDNDGRGTIELGYRTNDIGMAINKTGIGITTNGFYGIDVGGKVRTDQYVNNSLDLSGAAFATIAVGSAAGTSPTVDNTVTSVWGNGAHLKFTSGSSPTANGVICTVTLDTQYTFTDCAPIMQGRSTNAGAFNYSCSYNSGTRVITCTLVGTLAASTVYEFNLLFFGRN